MKFWKNALTLGGIFVTTLNTCWLVAVQMRQDRQQHHNADATSMERIISAAVEEATDSAFRARLPTIDIVSIGSLNRPDYQDAQQQTFGSHPSVRAFHRITERNDTSDVHCNSNLTMPIVKRIMHFCGRRIKPFETLDRIKRLFTDEGYLMKKSNPIAWMCAQRRPQDALFSLLQRYNNSTSLPDYLFLIDDDTWVNMDGVVPFISHRYPASGAYAITGCLARMRKVNFTFAYGGWGTILSKPTLQAWMKPIRCHSDVSSDDAFLVQACARLEKNGVGERHLFVDGMSVGDLMNAYVRDQEYADFTKWNPTGFCMHSDVTIAYFLNYYALPEHSRNVQFLEVQEDRMQGYNDSHYYVGKQLPGQRANRKQCLYKSDETCNPDAHLCHYITPQHMSELYGLYGETVNRTPETR